MVRGRTAWLGSALLVFSFLFCYAGVMWSLSGQWQSNDMYSYGFMIPLISAYLVWIQRERLAALPVRPDLFWGGLVLLAGLFALVLGDASGVLVVQELSLIVTLAGTVLTVLGRTFLKRLWFPIGYLLFMIPVWEIVTGRMHAPFQAFSARTATGLMQWLGVPAFQVGKFIELPNITLEVAEVCSGVNYLIAVLGIGIPVSYIFLDSWRRRILLLAIAVGIAALANSLRVALIGLFWYHGIGGEDLHGPYHLLQALSVSAVGYLALFVGAWVLATPGRRPAVERPAGRLRAGGDGRDRAYRPGVWPAGVWLMPVALLLLVGLHLHFTERAPVPLEKDLGRFPLIFGGWMGQVAAPPDAFYAELLGDDAFRARYRRGSEAVDLFISYYRRQTQGRELVGYRTAFLHSDSQRWALAQEGREPIEVNRLWYEGGQGNRRIIHFWYDLNGRIVLDPLPVKLYTAWDSLVHGRSNGAIVLVSATLEGDQEPDRVLRSIEDFTAAVFPHLKEFLPSLEHGW